MKKWKVYTAAFFIPFFLLLGFCVFSGIAPFGDHTFLYDDMKRQYAEFYAHYGRCIRDFLSGGGFPFYSTENGLGSGMIGEYAYYLTSPVLFVFAFLPLSAFPSVITFLVIGKLSLCSLTMSVYLLSTERTAREEVSGGRPYAAVLPFSAAFALCGFSAMACTNMMWFDAIAVFPLLLLFCERFLKEDGGSLSSGEGTQDGKKESRSALIPYIICVAAILFLNYYIGWMCLLFTAIWGLTLLPGIRKAGKWFLATLTGALIDAPVLIPAFLQLMQTDKEGDFSEATTLLFLDRIGTARFLTPGRILPKFFTLSFDAGQVFDGEPAVYCGVLLLPLFVLFFFRKSIPLKEKIRSLFMLALLFVSFCIPFLDRIWHAGSDPLGYLSRYSFLFCFVLIRCAWMELTGFMTAGRDESEAGGGIFPPGTVPALLIPAALCIYVFLCPCLYLDMKKKILNGVLFAAAIAFALTGRMKKAPHRLLYAGFSLLLLAELTLDFTYIYRIQSMGQMLDPEFREAAVSLENFAPGEKDRAFYRMIPERNYTDNDPFLGGYAGINVYSSLTPVNERLFLKRLGFHDNGLFTEVRPGYTKTSEAILGVCGKDTSSGAVKTVRTVAVDERDLWNGDPFRFSEAILQDFAGDTEKVFYDARKEMSEENDGSVIFDIDPVEDGKVYLYLMGAEEAGNTLQLNTLPVSGPASVNRDTSEADGIFYGNASNCRVICLGEYGKGERFSLRITGADTEQTEGLERNLLIVTEKEEALSALKEKADSRGGSLFREKASLFSGELSAGAGSRIVFPFPYDKGFTVKLNGVRIQAERYAEELLCIAVPEELTEGKISFTLSYLPDGFPAGLILCVVGWVLGAYFFVSERRAYGRY